MSSPGGVRAVLCAGLLCLPAAAARAQAPNPILTGIPANTALDLGAYTTDPICGVPIQVTDYSRFTYDPLRHQLLMFGGGHASTPRSSVDAFSFSTLRWSEAYPPTPESQLVQSNYDPALTRWISTGHPIARHTYDQLTLVPTTGDLVMLARGHGGAYCTGEFGWESGRVAHYQPVTRQWSFSPTADNTYPGDPYPGTEYDPVSGLIVIVANSGLWTYDPVTRAKVLRRSHSLDMGYANNLVYFPPNQKMYYFARGSPTRVWEVTLNRASWGASTIAEMATAGAVPNSQESGFAYDSWNQVIGGGVNAGVFYAFDPLAARWTSAVMQRAAGPAIGTQAFHCLDFDPVDGVFLFLTEYDSGSRMWAYRYANGTPPALSIDDRAVMEGAAAATLTVRLTRASTQTVTVAYATGGGTATPGVDYQAASGTLTFPPGTLTREVTVGLLGDTAAEPDETFFVDLSSPVNATVADGQGLATILDDEAVRFFTLPACRLADTRRPNGPSGGPALVANASRSFPTAGLCGVPADARALAVNVTVTGQTDRGNLRLYPAASVPPLASTINFAVGRPRANNAIVRLGAAGAIGVQCDMPPSSSGQTHVVLDVFGYFR